MPRRSARSASSSRASPVSKPDATAGVLQRLQSRSVSPEGGRLSSVAEHDIFALQIVVLVLMAAGVAGLLVQSFSTPTWTAIGLGHVGYPSIVQWATLSALLLYLVLGVLPARAGAGRVADVLPPQGEPRIRLASFILVWVGYAALMPYAGFAISTAATIAASLMLLDRFSRARILLGSVAATLLVYVAFRRLLYVGVPSGPVEGFLDRLLYSI